MLSFIQYIIESSALSSSGRNAERHAAKYLDPFLGGHSEVTHVLKSATKIGDTVHPAGTQIKIHATRDESGNRILHGTKNVMHAIVSVGDGPKHAIPNSKIEKPKLGTANELNTHLGTAFETSAALHLHQMTGSSSNTDEAHQNRIASIERQHHEAISKLPDHLQKEAIRLGRNAAEVYVKSLEHNHKIKSDDVHEVHWTPHGIAKIIGKKISRRQNPHDILVKTKDGRYHGASLKARSGTVSNNGLKTFDEHSSFNGHHTNLKQTWANHADDKDAQRAAALQHANAFNSGTHEEQKAHLHYLMKSHPFDVDYDYIDADQKKSIPILNHPAVKATDASTKLHALVSKSGTKVHIFDQDGKHLVTVEHRRPGKGRSPQANAKFGSLK